MKDYKLLGGEVLKLDEVQGTDLAFLDRLIAEAKAGRDYFELLRQVKGPDALPLRGDRITPAVANSVLYRVAHDVADRVGIEQGYVLAPGVDASTVKPSPDLLSMTEASTLIGITRAAVHQAILEERLRATRIGNAWIVQRQDAEAFREARASRGGTGSSFHEVRAAAAKRR